MHFPLFPSSVLYCLLYTCAFVFAVYFKNGKYHRNELEAVKQRSISVSVVCFGVILHLTTFVHKPDHSVFDFTTYEFSRFFIRFDNLIGAALSPVLLTLVLYLGPLFDLISSDCIYSGFGLESSRVGWIAARNLVIAPIVEELVFRAAIMFHMQSLYSHSCPTLCAVSALFFSLAHFHHVYGEMRHGKPFRLAFQTAVFQVCYTTIFGIYSGYLMLRTGNVISAIIAHSLCNYLGLPDPLGAIHRAKLRWGVMGQLLSIISHLSGLVLWATYLHTLTSPSWFGTPLNTCRW